MTENNIPKKIKVWWNDGIASFEWIEIFNEDLECDICHVKGAYYIQDDHFNDVGLCLTHLKKDLKKGFEKWEIIRI
jgi:hypothetical protein